VKYTIVLAIAFLTGCSVVTDLFTAEAEEEIIKVAKCAEPVAEEAVENWVESDG